MGNCFHGKSLLILPNSIFQCVDVDAEMVYKFCCDSMAPILLHFLEV